MDGLRGVGSTYAVSTCCPAPSCSSARRSSCFARVNLSEITKSTALNKFDLQGVSGLRTRGRHTDPVTS